MLQHLAAFCEDRGASAWLVGGTVRDIALGRALEDLDIAVSVNGLELARSFADSQNASFVALHNEYGTGRVVYAPRTDQRLVVDLSQLRGPTLEEDLRLRDFTINALALPLIPDAIWLRDGLCWQPSVVIDPCDGLRDLATRTLRCCTPSSLIDDPLRLLRAVRLAASLRMRIVPELDDAIRNSASLLAYVAPERVRDELFKILEMPDSARWLIYLDATGALTRIFPELESARACEQPIVHFLPVLEHSLETVVCVEWLLHGIGVQNIAENRQKCLPVAVQTHPTLSCKLPYAERLRNHLSARTRGGRSRAAALKLAALLHDIAKPQTRQMKPDGGVVFYGHQEIGADTVAAISQRLRLNRQEIAYTALIVRHHMRPGQLRTAEHSTRRAFVRFFRDTEDARPDVLIHELADHLATRGPHIDPRDWSQHIAWVTSLLDAYWSPPAQPTRPLLDGNEIMRALSIGPGKRVGELLREVQEAQAAGEIHTREEALALIRQLAANQSA